MDLRRKIYGFVAKLLVLVMVFQGWPFWQLSQEYMYVFPKERVQKILDLLSLLGPSEAEAAPPKAVCVPQLPTDLLVPHETWSGEPTILKSVVRDADNNVVSGSYYWDFGDGENTTPQPISDPSNLAATHTYQADPGTLFLARLNTTSLYLTGIFFQDFFETNFPSPNSIDGYEVLNLSGGGHWVVEDWWLRQKSNAATTMLLKEDMSLGDAIVQLEISGGDNETVGLVVRYQDPDNYYWAFVNE